MSKHKLGDLQFAIMTILWSQKQASASQVHAALLPERNLAITTIKTMLRKMEDRNLVSHTTQGRQFIYKPLIAESDVRESMLTDLIHRMFSGNSAALVNHLLDEGEINPDEIEQLKSKIAQKSKEQK